MRIEITTDGGFTGRGIGNAVVDSTEHDTVTRALNRAKPETWAREYRLEHGADLVRYTLTMEGVTTSWVTGAAIPEDLQAVFEAVWAAGRDR